MSEGGKEWLHSHNNYDEEVSVSSDGSNDTLDNFIQFKSHRNTTGLEEAISVTYPLPDFAVQPGTLRLSSILEENDIVPL